MRPPLAGGGVCPRSGTLQPPVHPSACSATRTGPSKPTCATAPAAPHAPRLRPPCKLSLKCKGHPRLQLGRWLPPGQASNACCHLTNGGMLGRAVGWAAAQAAGRGDDFVSLSRAYGGGRHWQSAPSLGRLTPAFRAPPSLSWPAKQVRNLMGSRGDRCGRPDRAGGALPCAPPAGRCHA